MNDKNETWEESETPGVFVIFGRLRRFLGYGVRGCSWRFSNVADALAWLDAPEREQDRDQPLPVLPTPKPEPKPKVGRSR